MITLSTAHAASRAEAALQATLVRFNAGATGALLALYSSVRPASGAAAGGPVMATFTFAKPAGTIASGILTLAAVADVLIMESGIALWGRITVAGFHEMDVSVSDPAGAGTIKLSTTQLYAGGTLRLSSGLFA